MKEESFGIIPLRKSQNWQVFLIQNKKGGHIGFPKGHKELLEDPKKTAIRELKEETNLDVLKFFDKTFEESYSFKKDGIKVEKKVKYFLALAGGEIKLQKEEISDGFWIDLDKALKKITFPEGKKIILEVKKIMEEAV
jgi:8-oxo-dGTP pyrophosphatase MutT (NUDIX family)